MSCQQKATSCETAICQPSGTPGLNGKSSNIGTDTALPTKSLPPFDEYLEMLYPNPSPEDKDYPFFASWGREQYLIKKYQRNSEQLRILERGQYDQLRFVEELERRGMNFDLKGDAYAAQMNKALVGTPLVTSKTAVSMFMGGAIAKNAPVIKMWDNGDGTGFYWAPQGKSVFGPFMGTYPNDDFEPASAGYTTEADYRARMAECRHPARAFELEGKYVQIPGMDGAFYVDSTRSSGPGNTLDASIQYVPAVPKKNGGGWKKEPRAKKQWMWLRGDVIQDVEIIA